MVTTGAKKVGKPKSAAYLRQQLNFPKYVLPCLCAILLLKMAGEINIGFIV